MQVEPSVIEKVNKFIVDEYTFWKEIFEGKYFDADVRDGVNLNLVRKHIIEAKMYCEDLLGDNYHLYPDSYFFPVPVELPDDFMVAIRIAVINAVYSISSNPLYEEVIKFDWDEVFQ